MDFVRLRRDETVHRRELKPRKPPPPQSPPPLPSRPQLESLNPNAETIAISATPVETDIEISSNGQPVEVPGVQNKFTYVIEQ